MWWLGEALDFCSLNKDRGLNYRILTFLSAYYFTIKELKWPAHQLSTFCSSPFLCSASYLLAGLYALTLRLCLCKKKQEAKPLRVQDCTYLHWLQQQHAGGGQHASFVQSTLTELRYYSYYNIHHFYFSKLPHKPMLAKPKCSGVHWPQSTTASIKALLKATNTRKPFFQVNAHINQLEQFQHYDQKQQHGMKNTQDISWNRNPQRAIICTTCKLL